MKIAWVCERLQGGGSERFTCTLSNHFSKKTNYRVYVFSGKETENDYVLSENVKRINCITKDYFKDAKTIIRKAELYKIDILIGVGIYSNLCLGLIAKRVHSKIILCERNAPKYDELSWKTKCLRKILFQRADYFVFQTREAQQFYCKRIQEKSCIIHNPVLDGLPYRTGRNENEVVAVGRLEKQKNYPLLIKAFKGVTNKYPEAILKIYGKGSQECLLKEMISRLNLEKNIFLCGFSDNVHTDIINASIFVLSSDFEGMPNSLMEAMAMGFPVITTRFHGGGADELIDNMDNGLVVPIGNEKELTSALLRLIEDYELKKKISKNAEKIRTTHSVEEIGNIWEKVFSMI